MWAVATITVATCYVYLPYSLLALACCAREYNYSRPQLTDSNVIVITAGRLVPCFSPTNSYLTNSAVDSG